MSFGSMLDVGIGLAFVFVLLSTMASAIQEMIATVLSMRGKIMQDMITQMLDHAPTPAPGTQGTTQVMPAIGPQGTPPETLSDRVLGHPLIAGLGTPNLPGWLHRLIGSSKSPSYIPAANFTTALIETLRTGHDDALVASTQVKNAVALLPANHPLRRTLQAFMTEAQGDFGTFRTRVQSWFDDSMDRAGGARFVVSCRFARGPGMRFRVRDTLRT